MPKGAREVLAKMADGAVVVRNKKSLAVSLVYPDGRRQRIKDAAVAWLSRAGLTKQIGEDDTSRTFGLESFVRGNYLRLLLDE
jgi:hypothetical protein